VILPRTHRETEMGQQRKEEAAMSLLECLSVLVHPAMHHPGAVL